MSPSLTEQGANRGAKARRGPLSCAECRRLKIRCNSKEQIPCTPCQKRGCAMLCPDGSLVSKGSRYILSDTEQLHKKIEELTLRVRELEKALDEETAGQGRTHPLLDDAYRAIAAPPTQADHAAEADEGAISTQGTIVVNDSGTSKWLGPTAVAAWFLEDELDGATEQPEALKDKSLPADVMIMCHAFPFGNVVADERTRDVIYSYLPQEQDEASLLVERYFLNIGWLYNFTPKRQLENWIRTCYDPASPTPLHPHRLAVMYMVFALNTLIDAHPRPYWSTTTMYCELARAALGLDNVFQTTTLATIQALGLLSLWYQLADDSGDPSKSWGCLGLTFKLMQKLGMHRDGKKWNLPEEEAIERRRIFWEIESMDCWQAMGYGRPPSLVRPHFDTTQPFDTEESLGHAPQFFRWKHHYISEGIMNVLDQALINNSATTTTHATILKLDQKIRSCAIPLKLKLNPETRATADEMAILQYYVAVLCRESAIMYLHRGFFARAVFEGATDPLQSKFAHSVLSVYNSSRDLLRGFREVLDEHPHLLPRVFGWWGHAFSSAVSLGGLVSMAPHCNLSRESLLTFDEACETLKRGVTGPQAGRVLPALNTLSERAHKAFADFEAGNWQPAMTKGSPPADMPGLGAPKVPVTKKGSTGSTSSLSPESNPASQSPLFGGARFTTPPAFAPAPAPAPAPDYPYMATNAQIPTWQTQYQQPLIQTQPQPSPTQRHNVEHPGHRRSGSFPSNLPIPAPSFPAHQHQQVAARGLRLPPLQPNFNGVNDPNGNSFNDYLRIQQGTHSMHQMPDMTVVSGPSFDHGAMATPVQNRYGPTSNNFGNWTISPTTTSPVSGVSPSSQPLYGMSQQQSLHAQAQGLFNQPMQNGYDPTVYPVNGNDHVQYSQPQSAPQAALQNGWPTRNAGVVGPQGILYEQDGTQVVYNDNVWNMFMSNLGMDMGG